MVVKRLSSLTWRLRFSVLVEGKFFNRQLLEVQRGSGLADYGSEGGN